MLIEQNFDDAGIIWNQTLTPFHVHIIGLNIKKFENVSGVCEQLYKDLGKLGYDVLLDDRDESPGIKFNDADLLGFPIQIIAGKKNVDNGNVELKYRRTGEREVVAISDVINKIKDFYQN